jgi:hypothetical protein
LTEEEEREYVLWEEVESKLAKERAKVEKMIGKGKLTIQGIVQWNDQHSVTCPDVTPIGYPNPYTSLSNMLEKITGKTARVTIEIL